MELEQNENFLSSDFVNQDYDQNFNQGSMKRYVDIQDNVPPNISMRKQISTSYTTK